VDLHGRLQDSVFRFRVIFPVDRDQGFHGPGQAGREDEPKTVHVARQGEVDKVMPVPGHEITI
jgi:hypothetical protein